MSSETIPRRAKGRRTGRRDDIRAELLTIMVRLLDSGEGYSRLSVERLASEAGMSRTRFYMYFEDKADLLHSAYLTVTEETRVVVGQWWSDDEDIDRETLRRIIRELVRTRARHARVAAAVHVAAATDTTARIAIDEIKQEFIATFTAKIERDHARGAIDRSLDARATAGWLGWMIERGIDQLVPGTGPAAQRKVADAMTTVIWNTLYAS